MTELEWLASEDAQEMLRCLERQHNANRKKIGRRKVRLFGCASCRLLWESMVDERSRKAVEFAERMIDHLVTSADLSSVRDEARQAVDSQSSIKPNVSSSQFSPYKLFETWRVSLAACTIVGGVASSAYAHPAMTTFVGEGVPQARQEWLSDLRDLSHLLRDIFGNPFRPITVNHSWLTSTVVALATGIYEERAFDRMPILADALQDVGCDNADILNHCRQPGEHVRGCWCVDLLLDKK
jgi:hypothetical protein